MFHVNDHLEKSHGEGKLEIVIVYYLFFGVKIDSCLELSRKREPLKLSSEYVYAVNSNSAW